MAVRFLVGATLLGAGAATGEDDHGDGPIPGTCGAVKEMYRDQACCGNPDQEVDFVVTAKPTKAMFGGHGDGGSNPCHGAQPVHADPTANSGDGDYYFQNVDCLVDGVTQTLEQAGADITAGYQGGMDADGRVPITDPYWFAGLCPVNVHWHVGTEHRSEGEFDENGVGPEYEDTVEDVDGDIDSRRLVGEARLGMRCHHYDENDAKFTTPYNWQHCIGMHVGETYEVHWPHSAAGRCGSPWQYQTPFYDGVFCTGGIITLSPLNTFEKIGVQGQVFTIVNDEDYYYPDLFRGAIVDGEFWQDVGHYTGSTTGTSRSNTVCSRYTPITWQVDRKCHLISASSFDKMCADMKAQQDDMSSDLHAHGSRELVDNQFVADNLQRRV